MTEEKDLAMGPLPPVSGKELRNPEASENELNVGSDEGLAQFARSHGRLEVRKPIWFS